MTDKPLSTVYCDELELVECFEKCPKCRVSLHYKKDQGIAFCWECTVDRETARRGRELLSRVRKQAIMDDIIPDPEETGRAMFGTPL